MTEVERGSETIAEPPVTVGWTVSAFALDLPATISFSCYGCQFSAVARDSTDGAVISVEGVVGAIPFSAESPAARATTRAMLALRPSLDIVRLELTERYRIVLRGQAPLGDHPSRAGAVAAASAVMSAAKPLMDILAVCGAGAVSRPIDGADTEAAKAAAVAVS